MLADEVTTEPDATTGKVKRSNARLASSLLRLAITFAEVPGTQVCLHCGGGGGRNASEGGVVCNSLDCSVYFERRKVAFEMAAAQAQLDAALPLLE